MEEGRWVWPFERAAPEECLLVGRIPGRAPPCGACGVCSAAVLDTRAAYSLAPRSRVRESSTSATTGLVPCT